ncbi:MAG: hypothetical protein IPH07_26255 [Deltaproteobacteria bacterium]|nr:hypothetical protein [Deltaproteobacteria bacterium]MBK8718265.1 hypothetical protein [Deltaproteobacteria bacterium]MBP7291089.1 hypothetical protein [Nannocystaceae bacterium]
MPTAIEDFWTHFDLCNGTPLDRENPDLAAYVAGYHDAPTEGVARCHWSEKSPHNLELMFMAMGDALTKTGDIELARVFYEGVSAVPGSES